MDLQGLLVVIDLWHRYVMPPLWATFWCKRMNLSIQNARQQGTRSEEFWWSWIRQQGHLCLTLSRCHFCQSLLEKHVFCFSAYKKPEWPRLGELRREVEIPHVSSFAKGSGQILSCCPSNDQRIQAIACRARKPLRKTQIEWFRAGYVQEASC